MTTHALLQQGALVTDQWRLERKLGEGATSSVWEAESLRLGGRVAIKFLGREHLANESMRQRFIREARAICKVRSQHVVQILDHGVSHGVPFLVMELLEGEDLGRMLERERTVSLAETASVVDQLCRGLGKAHALGFVHRDIKPENVFVIHENDGGHFIKLLDFGIAKQLDTLSAPLTQHDTILGTAHYLSPEQIDTPQEVDQRTDIWSVGVLAYHMLLGKLPFSAETWPELCARILDGSFSPPSVERPGLPSELDAWFRKAMQRDREQRFPTVQAASVALSGIARAHSSSVRRRDAQPARKDDAGSALESAELAVLRRARWVRLTLAGAVIGLAIAGALLAWSVVRQPEKHAAQPTRRAPSAVLPHTASPSASGGVKAEPKPPAANASPIEDNPPPTAASANAASGPAPSATTANAPAPNPTTLSAPAGAAPTTHAISGSAPLNAGAANSGADGAPKQTDRPTPAREAPAATRHRIPKDRGF